MTDLELLRKYEPIARFNKGEAFYPIAVGDYVEACSLWSTDPQGKDQMLVPQEQLDIDHLANFDEIPADHKIHLRFVDEPLQGRAFQRWLRDPERERFTASGRLVRVPLVFRLADALFDISLLVRGQVPGGHAAAADLKNRTITSKNPRRVYYGRVVRSGGWIALQYLFFYSMNNWRSGFAGVNDHEADWEQVFVFLTDPKTGDPEPRWVAYASHDFKGDDLRRRWDDPLLVRKGVHPVIFVGAGSHASYFEQGEYLMGTEPEFLQPVAGAINWLRKLWADTLGMGRVGNQRRSTRAMLSVPFVDYARGDGLSIGPDQKEAWEPVLISDDVKWVHNYHGLWGLDTHDPIGGERAPAGPKFNRDGSVRQSWYDPVGWAGLDKVFPPDEIGPEIDERLMALRAELSELDSAIEKERAYLREYALDVEALKVTEYFSTLRDKKEDELKETQITLEKLQVRRVELAEAQQALESYARRVKTGDFGPPTAHLRHVHHPEPPLLPRHRVVEIWGALSVSLILLGVVLLIAFQPTHWLVWLIGFGVALGGVEALTRGNLINYLLNITIILAVISAIILLVEFWTLVLILGLIGVAILVIRGNLQELRS